MKWMKILKLMMMINQCLNFCRNLLRTRRWWHLRRKLAECRKMTIYCFTHVKMSWIKNGWLSRVMLRGISSRYLAQNVLHWYPTMQFRSRNRIRAIITGIHAKVWYLAMSSSISPRSYRFLSRTEKMAQMMTSKKILKCLNSWGTAHIAKLKWLCMTQNLNNLSLLMLYLGIWDDINYQIIKWNVMEY